MIWGTEFYNSINQASMRASEGRQGYKLFVSPVFFLGSLWRIMFQENKGMNQER